MMLSPPRSKKLSSMLSAAAPRISAASAHRVSSCAVRGPRPWVSPVPYSGAGRALRSSLPFGVSGSAGSVTKPAGTM